MPIKHPGLDDRKLPQIMEALKTRAQTDVPEWKPPPEGDAGTMLYRIFSRLLELTLQRLNQVPEKNMLAFLNTMGVSLLPPSPARVPLSFTITPGSSPIRVPKGTQAGTKPAGQQAALVFETEDDLTVIPAQITAAWTMDPKWDRYTDLISTVSGQDQTGFTPFVGTQRMPHVLYIGDDVLLNFGRPTHIEIKTRGGDIPYEVKDLFKTLMWQCRSNNEVKKISPVDGQSGEFQLLIPFTIDNEPIQGTGMADSIRSRWLRAILTTPFPDELTAQNLKLSDLTLKVSASGLLPDLAYCNTAPVDVTKDFYMFGEIPKTGDTLYLASKEVFSKAEATVTIIYNIRNPSENTATMIWEYLGENGWETISVNVASSSGPGNSKNFTVTFSMPRTAIKKVNGQENNWLRVRISSNGFGSPAEYVPVNPTDASKGYTLKPGTGNLNPPIITKLTLGYEAERSPAVLAQNGFLYINHTQANRTGTEFSPFSSIKDLSPRLYADTGPTFYLGFDAAFPEKPVTLYVAVMPRAFSGSVIKETRAFPAQSSSHPPLMWEYFNGTKWLALTVFDMTNNLTESGTLGFLTPADISSLAKFDQAACYWIRALSSDNDTFNTQRLLGIFLNTIPAVQAVTVQNEIMGSSNGQTNQTMRFARTPTLPGQQVVVREPEKPSDTERQAIEQEEGADAVQERMDPVSGKIETFVRWHEVANFLKSDPHSRHYTLDHTNGILNFGDGKRGMIPPTGTNTIIAEKYRAGGGAAGNTPKGTIVQVKSPVPGVASVTNPVAADGGAAVETVPMVEERGPQMLKHRHYAVTGSDIEWMARQAAGTRVARARCLPNINRDLYFEPGWTTLIIVPQGSESKLSPGAELIRQVEDYLETRAFTGVSHVTPGRINVIGPGYVQVAVIAEIVPQDIGDAEQVKQRVLESLSRFLHPLMGGPDGTGWEFARDVYESEICQVLENIPGINHVRTLKLIPNISQRYFTFTSVTVAKKDLSEGSAVMTKSHKKAALLAEPVQMGSAIERIAIKGFKEGDRITMVLDLKVTSVNGTTLTVKALDEETPEDISAMVFPSGSPVTTLDGVKRTRLKRPLKFSGAGTQLDVEDNKFVKEDELTVFYPFPMAVTSVTVEDTTQMLGIEPYEPEIKFPEDSIIATLDNRIRQPLFEEIPANNMIKSIRLKDFDVGDEITVSRHEGNLTIQDTETVEDVVFLDDNFLVYPGIHHITMVADTTAISKERTP